jgi:hypothetical protein
VAVGVEVVGEATAVESGKATWEGSLVSGPYSNSEIRNQLYS